ncbi:MAG: AraC family transcriptional regulator [Clostridiales bacterium]|nr:AraC family transcriptional regulator [Clostridiales bacterium]
MTIPTVSIEHIEEMKVIYVRFRGPYAEFRKQSRKMFQTVFAFAKQHHLIVEEVTKVLTIYHDNPFVTDAKNVRTSVAVTIPKNALIEENDDISVMSISGKFAVGHFEISPREYGEAWEYMYQKWLFAENVEPRDGAPFELYVTEPPKNGQDKSFTDIYIPIQ